MGLTIRLPSHSEAAGEQGCQSNMEGLRELRRIFGWSQSQAAKWAGVSPRTWQRWERGEEEPRPQMQARIAAAVRASAIDPEAAARWRDALAQAWREQQQRQ